jgi:16S rRNA (cytidine1402-2'-O)-methyltransferase
LCFVYPANKLIRMSPSTGTLYIVGTPIGNVEDVTLRALRVLGVVDLIAAEDTRHTGLFLNRHQIHRPLVSYHEFNEARRTPELLAALQQGRSIALVSDAGMPALTDPGQRLIQAAIAHGMKIEVIPGPSAITAALVGSGLPAQPFLFYGFLPYKSAQRRKVLGRLAPLPHALIFFESPHRLGKSLADMRDCLGDRRAVVARELTKKFEEFWRGEISTLLKNLENRPVKGEITVIVEGCSHETH